MAEAGAPARAGGGEARALAGRSLGIVALQAGNSLSQFAITWLLVRQIGVDGFGLYSVYFIVAINAVAVLAGLVLQPLNSLASQYSPERQAGYVRAAGAFVWTLLAGIGVLAVIAWMAAPALGFDPAPVLATLALIAGMAVGEFWRRLRFFAENVRAVAIYDIARYVLLALVFLLLPQRMPEADASTYAVAIAATYFLALLPTFAVPRGLRDRSDSGPQTRVRLTRLLRSGKWLAGVAFLKFLDGGAVMLIAFALLGAYEAGLIRIAQSIVGLTTPAIQTLEHVLPRLLGTRIREIGLAAALRGFSRFALAILAAFTLLYASVTLAAPFILALMGVEQTQLGMFLVAGFGLFYLLTVAMILVEFCLRASDRARTITALLLAGAAVVLIGSWPAISAAGALGAIAVMVMARLVSVMLGTRQIRGLAAAHREIAD